MKSFSYELRWRSLKRSTLISREQATGMSKVKLFSPILHHLRGVSIVGFGEEQHRESVPPVRRYISLFFFFARSSVCPSVPVCFPTLPSTTAELQLSSSHQASGKALILLDRYYLKVIVLNVKYVFCVLYIVTSVTRL